MRDNIDYSDPGARRRHQWSNIEVEALIEGVRNYGTDFGAIINDPYYVLLEGLTAVQLQNKWNYLVRQKQSGDGEEGHRRA